MYADRYAKPTRFSPSGLTAAVAINAGLVAALIFAAPHVMTAPPKGAPIDIFTVPTDPPPPPPESKPKPHDVRARVPDETIVAPKQIVQTITDPVMPVVDPPVVPQPFTDRIGTDTVAKPDPGPTAAPLPPLIAPSVDPRYADALQPPYPAAERRAGREGRVTVRVLIGVDGRVKQIERVDATSDAFWNAARTQALSRWRFRPATRGGVPEEAWRTMTLRFVLEES
ncbi:TonB family protein [Sphingomonas sp. GV3]|uniref:energy transducer TonB n=1 Tax=Sphingomonas sp. GV3 TaxID=3040671 RepID=UPI00280BCBE9|nr:TonB family protein [Sphingomonas sp. GV3]